jgi:DNA invertase Pin-like site-specific DNA recombinase
MVKKQVALYLRVSTNAQSTDAQLTELRQLVEQRGWKYEVFCDKGQSGMKESRPAFDEMMRQVRRGRFSSTCVWALDRLARSLRQLLDISLELQRLNVDLVAVKQDLDTSSPSGRLVFGVLSTVAEFERDLLRERVRWKAHRTASTSQVNSWGDYPAAKRTSADESTLQNTGHEMGPVGLDGAHAVWQETGLRTEIGGHSL